MKGEGDPKDRTEDVERVQRVGSVGVRGPFRPLVHHRVRVDHAHRHLLPPPLLLFCDAEVRTDLGEQSVKERREEDDEDEGAKKNRFVAS
jgi:hypothetical protein